MTALVSIDVVIFSWDFGSFQPFCGTGNGGFQATYVRSGEVLCMLLCHILNFLLIFGWMLRTLDRHGWIQWWIGSWCYWRLIMWLGLSPEVCLDLLYFVEHWNSFSFVMFSWKLESWHFIRRGIHSSCDVYIIIINLAVWLVFMCLFACAKFLFGLFICFF